MPSSGILHHVALVGTYISEERIATIVEVKKINELGKMIAVTGNCNTVWVYLLQRDLVASYC
jgi:hypothetical protein